MPTRWYCLVFMFGERELVDLIRIAGVGRSRAHVKACWECSPETPVGPVSFSRGPQTIRLLRGSLAIGEIFQGNKSEMSGLTTVGSRRLDMTPDERERMAILCERIAGPADRLLCRAFPRRLFTVG